MSNMSRNNSTTSLMGFSVHQPQLGAMLEFFPAMGTQQLDEMIDAYIPGDLSILDKRTAVTMEFFQHSMTTGELFKFFMVYPTNTAESPATSLQDSAYGSAFASPVVSEPRWSASTSKKARIASVRTTGATAADFSHIPGMKIMTRDGQDVTNSASRGCKTKEQRDHAHLMRIMKACDACKKKKVRCDPSHKRAAIPAVADSKVKKATKKASSASKTIQASVPPIDTVQDFADAFNPTFDSLMSFDAPAQDSWEQFVSFDEDELVAAPNVDFNYDFFYDPAGHFSPTSSFTSGFNSGSSSNSASPSQTFTPIQASTGSSLAGLADGSSSKDGDGSLGLQATDGVVMPSLPYMENGGMDAGNYVDFALYSPESTSSFDDDLSSYSQEVRAASVSERVSTLPAYTVQQRLLGSRGGSLRSTSVAVSSDGLDSSSAFAHTEQYGFDRGTHQGDHMSAGVISGARIRGENVHPHDGNGYSSAGALSSTTDSAMLRASETLVPRGSEAVPRPPAPQDLAAAAAGSGTPAYVARGSISAKSGTRSDPDNIRSGPQSESRLATMAINKASTTTDIATVNGRHLDEDASLQSIVSATTSHRKAIVTVSQSQFSSLHTNSDTIDATNHTATATSSVVSQQTAFVRNVGAQATALASVTTTESTPDGRCQQPSSPAELVVPEAGANISWKQSDTAAQMSMGNLAVRHDQQYQEVLSGSQKPVSQQSAMNDSMVNIKQSVIKDRLDITTIRSLLAVIAVVLLLVQDALAKNTAIASWGAIDMMSLLVVSSMALWNKSHLTASQDGSATCPESDYTPTDMFTPTQILSHAVTSVSHKIRGGLRRTVEAISALQCRPSYFTLPQRSLVFVR